MMEIKVDVTDSTIKESAIKFRALKNEAHLKLILFIEKNPNLSLDEIHKYAQKERLYINRQSTHKVLQILTKSGFIKKVYDELQSKITYQLKF